MDNERTKSTESDETDGQAHSPTTGLTGDAVGQAASPTAEAANPTPPATSSVRYTLTPRTAPLASKKAGSIMPSFGASAIRAETEDDDGYDPYSDRQPSQRLFEEDPWS